MALGSDSLAAKGSRFPLSVLDLCPILAGGNAAQAFQRSLDLAGHTETLGYRRYWVAEHHNMPGIASAATSVVIGHIAGGTSRIRVGSGGIMLLNHSPLAIAEQFGTLESLYPGRIDLGLGRPGAGNRSDDHASTARTFGRRWRRLPPKIGRTSRLSKRSCRRATCPGSAG